MVYGLHKEWWWVVAFGAIVLSQLLIFLYWKDAKAGTVINIVILMVAIVAAANWHFTNRVNTEVDILFQHESKEGQRVEEAQLSHLPMPVQRWLRRSGIVGKEIIQSVRLKQEGLMRMKPSQKNWIKAQAVQYITIDKPGFVWSVKMDVIPLLSINGRDLYYNGHGQMAIKLFSLVNIVNAADPKIDQGSLQRWLAEIGWYPSAALNPYIQWDGINEAAAKATVTEGGTSGSVIFFFTSDGDLLRMEADRYMGGGNKATLEKWKVQSKAYGSFNGVRIPVESEAAWHLKDGEFIWYKLKIKDVEFNKPQRF